MTVLAGATWPRAWLLPCAGSSASREGPRRCPSQLQGKLVASEHSRCVLRSCSPCIADLPSTSRVNQYRIKPHQMVTAHACTWGGVRFQQVWVCVVEPDLYYTRAEPKIDEGNRHISKPWPTWGASKAGRCALWPFSPCCMTGVLQYRIKPHQMVTVHIRTREEYGFGECGPMWCCPTRTSTVLVAEP